MRTVLTHSSCWPYVRRGTERNMDELARYLSTQGHEVTTISTRPGPGTVEQTEEGTRILHRNLWHPLFSQVRITPSHFFFFNALRSLRTVEADVVHSFYFFDSLAASIQQRRRGYATVLQMNGVPIPGVSCYRWWPPDARLIREAIWRADYRITCSNFVRGQVLEHFGKDSEVISPPVNVDAWKLGKGPENGRPTLVALADFSERRKGVRVLVKAFARVKSAIPEAVLRLSGRMSPTLKAQILKDLPESIRTNVEILGLGRVEDVSRLYRKASVTVLPSMWEPSGTIMVESWASGTPVVATNHAGLPEFFGEGVGVLFDPKSDQEETMNVEGLAEALIEAVSLSQRDGIRLRCRAHAQQFSTQASGHRVEQLYAGC